MLIAFNRNILVVANVTATPDELFGNLIERAQRDPAAFTILVPATSAAGGRAAAQEQLEAAVARLRKAGLEALPLGTWKWLHAGQPERISKLTGTLVSHIVSEPPRAAVQMRPPPRRADKGLGPLTVLGWGRPPDTDKRAPDART